MRIFLNAAREVLRLALRATGDNERSIAIGRHDGFVPDGLLDRIMIGHEEPHQ